MFPDVFQTEFPHQNVSAEEDKVQDDAKAVAYVFLHHQQPVVHAVQEGRDEYGHNEEKDAFAFLEFRQTEEIAHRHAEEEMSRHGEDGASDGGAHTRLCHIRDVLDAGKTQ